MDAPWVEHPVCLGNSFAPSRRAATIGIALPSTLMHVVDLEGTTSEVVDAEPGELLIQGPQVFTGYSNNAEESERTLLPGGWLHTGNVVTVDADRFTTTIVDRVKELIITGGFNVSPWELEAVLQAHPDVVEPAVVGMPASTGGESVIAAVIMRTGASLDEADLRAWCRDRLAAQRGASVDPRAARVAAIHPRKGDPQASPRTGRHQPLSQRGSSGRATFARSTSTRCHGQDQPRRRSR